MPLETLTLPHTPPGTTIHLALFSSLPPENASFLHQQLLARNTAFEYAFLDAAPLLSRTHLLAAVFRAITLRAAGKLITPNVHSEVVLCLSGSNNISEAYRRYGITPTTRDVIIVKILTPHPDSPVPQRASDDDIEAVSRHLETHVQGTAEEVTDETIAAYADLARVRKYYKLNGAPALAGLKGEEERKEMEMLIIGAMALRGV